MVEVERLSLGEMRFFNKKKPKEFAREETPRNICDTCARKYNQTCPYGNGFAIACSEYVLVGFGQRAILVNEPDYAPRAFTPNRLLCPRCGSDAVRSAGYKDRWECLKCGKVFT